jgi:hypothetical protein
LAQIFHAKKVITHPTHRRLHPEFDPLSVGQNFEHRGLGIGAVVVERNGPNHREEHVLWPRVHCRGNWLCFCALFEMDCKFQTNIKKAIKFHLILQGEEHKQKAVIASMSVVAILFSVCFCHNLCILHCTSNRMMQGNNYRILILQEGHIKNFF